MQIDLPEYVERMIEASSVCIVKIDHGQVTKSGGSGCFVSFAGQRHLLTVKHVLDKDIRHLVLGWNATKGDTDHEQLRNETSAVQTMVKEGMNSLDGLAWKGIEPVYFDYPGDAEMPVFQKLGTGGVVLDSKPCTVFPETKLTTPKQGVLYGFGGHTSAVIKADDSISKDVLIRLTEYRKCYSLTYAGRSGEFYAFNLPAKHPGHGYFKGCSGAPIIDADGNVVALLSEGMISEDTVYGVPVKTYLLTLMGPYLAARYQQTGDPRLPENLRKLFTDES